MVHNQNLVLIKMRKGLKRARCITFPGGKPGMVACKIAGDCMAPKYLDGEIIVIDTKATAISGNDVVAFNKRGQMTFKQFWPSKKHIELRPLNPSFPSIIVKKNEIGIFGVVKSKVSLDNINV